VASPADGADRLDMPALETIFTLRDEY